MFADSAAEVFLEAPNESLGAEAARECALLAPLSLKHRCPVATIRHALNGRETGPLVAALSRLAHSEAFP